MSLNEELKKQWHERLEAIKECRERKAKAESEGKLCFDGGRELTDYNCNLQYRYGMPADAATIIRENQIASQRYEHDKKEQNKEASQWLFGIIIGIIILAGIIFSNHFQIGRIL